MKNRTAFTLIEMLVAMTLTLFIMIIVTTAFVAGLETFRQMKGIGDMAEKLRMAAQRLQADLKADHFEGNRHLGDLAFTSQGKVRYGFFRIVQPTILNAAGTGYFGEGTDLDGLPSMRATDHFLHFTVKMRGDRPQDFFKTAVPNGPPYPAAPPPPFATDPKPFDPNSPFFKPTNFFGQPFDASYQQVGTFSSQWAEVAYFLVPTGSIQDPDNLGGGGTPLFSLYRVQRLVVPRTDQIQNMIPANQLANYAALSCQPDNPNPNNAVWLVFNAPEDLAGDMTLVPPKAAQRSFSTPSSGVLPTPNMGAALVVTNVISFQVQVSFTGGPFQDASYDTAVQAAAPARISALQVTIRIFDPVSRQTRQITTVQDM